MFVFTFFSIFTLYALANNANAVAKLNKGEIRHWTATRSRRVSWVVLVCHWSWWVFLATCRSLWQPERIVDAFDWRWTTPVAVVVVVSVDVVLSSVGSERASIRRCRLRPWLDADEEADDTISFVYGWYDLFLLLLLGYVECVAQRWLRLLVKLARCGDRGRRGRRLRRRRGDQHCGRGEGRGGRGRSWARHQARVGGRSQ